MSLKAEMKAGRILKNSAIKNGPKSKQFFETPTNQLKIPHFKSK
jgi:hypothetical protein